MRMPILAVAGILAAAVFIPVAQAAPCHHVPGFTSELAIKFPSDRSVAMLDIAYIGKAPPAAAVAKALRQCLAQASALDPSMDMLGTPWLRASAKSKPANDAKIDAFGPMKFISYRANTRKIAVEDLLANLKKKKS